MDKMKLRHGESENDYTNTRMISLEDLSPGRLKSLRTIHKCGDEYDRIKKADRMGIDFAEYEKYKHLL